MTRSSLFAAMVILAGAQPGLTRQQGRRPSSPWPPSPEPREEGGDVTVGEASVHRSIVIACLSRAASRRATLSRGPPISLSRPDPHLPACSAFTRS